MTTPENNRFKRPLFLALAAVCGVLAVVGLVSGTWWMAIGGVVFLVLCLWSARIVQQGGNPWWMRAPLDRRPPRQR